MAAERRENLDHLQKANSRQPTQAKQKMAQVTPVGIWDRFPTARTVQQMIDTMERIMEDPSTYPLMREGEEEDEWSPKSYGRYSSRIALPENIETEKIKAEVKDGVLYITIPKAKTSSKVLDIDVQ
ncbi:hypothetical protein AAC387_Pa07g1808 [Persea americana]